MKIMRFIIAIFFILNWTQAFAITYTFSDTNVSPSFGGCSRISAVNYTCSSAVTLSGTDSIVVTGTLPKTITFTSNLSLNFQDESNSAKINSGGSAANLNLIVNGALSIGKKVIIMANIQAGSVDEYGGDVVFGGSINTTTGNIAIGYSSDITGSITSTSGQIRLFDQVTVGGTVSSTSGAINFPNKSTISGNVSCSTCTFTLTGLNSRINGTTQVGTLSDNSNFNTPGTFYGGSISTLTGSATIGSGATVYGNITSNSAGITVKESAVVWGEITVKNASSTNYIRINQNAIINGSIYTNSSSLTANIYVDIENSATVNGSIVGLGRDYTYVNLSNNARVNGDITAFGDDAAIVTLNGNSTINGHVKATSVDIDDGDVNLQANARITGNITAFGDIDNYGQINGCAHSTYTAGTNISLRSGSSNSGGSCCGSNRTSCSSSCVSNSSGTATALCQSNEAIVVNARGELANGVWPIMELWVNQVKVDTVVVNSSTAQNYTFYANLPATSGFKLDLVFPNDAYVSPSEDRNLYINSINYRGKTILSTDASVTRDYGVYSSEFFDGINTDGPGDVMLYKGAMRFNTAEVLIAYYALDEPSWNGTLNETKDTAGYSGGPFDGQGIGTPKPTSTTANPARAGATGTCGYAYFQNATNGSAFTLDGLPVSASSGSKTTVSFWMFWAGGDNVAIGWGNYNLWFGFGSFGFSTYNSDIYGISSTGLQNRWVHVVAIFTNGGVASNEIYIDGVKQTLSQRMGSPLNTNAFVQSTLRLSGAGDYSWGFQNSFIDEVKIYNGAVTQSQVTTDYNATHTCPIYVTNVNASSFNCIATQESTIGSAVSTGRLYTQLVNTPFAINVVALNNSNPPVAETSFSAASDRTAILRFRDQISNSLINFSGGDTVSSKNVLFTTSNSTGIVTVTGISIANAYRNLRCEISEASVTTPSASSDNFAVRPVALTLSSTNASEDAAGVSSTTLSPTKTGANFNLSATAKNAANATLNNYNGTPVIHPWTNPSYLWVHSGGLAKGTLAGSFSAASAGIASGNFTYTEVGYFRLGTFAIHDTDFTAVDQTGDCINTAPNEYANTAINGKYGCKFSNTADTSYFGRFIPDRFAITSSSSTPACGTFNYYGQDGASTTFQLSAQNSSNTVTQNYSGVFAKLPLNAWSASTGFRFAATGLTSGMLSSGSVAPTGSWSNGVATVTANHKIDRLASPMNPATVSMTAQPIDSDGVTMSAVSLGSTIPFRYGRLNLKNAYGSELLDLTVPITAEYWDGTTYRKNTLDNCTNITTPNMTLSNYKKNLNAGETTLSGGGFMNQGQSTVTLSKPGAGNSGTVDLTFSLTNFPWMGTSNPAARVTFGLYKSPIIYMRENF